MKHLGFIKKAVCAAAAACMFVMPLAACGEDGDISGERVTEQGFRDGIQALKNANNYTVKSEFNSSTTGGYYYYLYKVDIKNNVIYYEYEKNRGTSIRKAKEYYFYDDAVNKIINCTAYSYKKSHDEVSESKEASVYSESAPPLSWQDVSAVRNILNCAIDKEFNDFKYDTKDGAYVTRDVYYEGELVNRGEERIYFSDGRLFAMKDNREGESYAKCYNFGSTKITVPNNVKQAVENHKKDGYKNPEYDYEE